MFRIANSPRRTVLAVLLSIACATGAAAAAGPQTIDGPVGPALALKVVGSVPVEAVPFTDIDAAMAEDELASDPGLPQRFALPEPAALTPDNSGAWMRIDEDHDLWRVMIDAPGAVSLNLGFSRFQLPKGARVSLYPFDYQGKDDRRGVRVFDASDNRADGRLWTPIVLTDQMIVELLLPSEYGDGYQLEIGSINRGYRYFGAADPEKSGSCNIDVVCPEGDGWWTEINSVARITISGSYLCTGVMINNTAQDGTPYFLTADHCGVTSTTDQTVVAYWNYQSTTCGALGGGSLADFTSGTTFLVDNTDSDVTLLQLNQSPDPSFGVTFSGWDRRDQITSSAVGIHHPSGDEKAISFEYDPTQITSRLGYTSPGDGLYLRVVDWDLGTTEGGSSGSPLYSPEHRIVGQLYGGYAACNNDLSDWYGRFYSSWPYLASYLDPLGTGAETLDSYDPYGVGIQVAPTGIASAEGDTGGPFTPSSFTFTVTNVGGEALDFEAMTTASWLTVTGGSGTLAGYASADVTVDINSAAGALANGDYDGVVSFRNLTDGSGDTDRVVNLRIGVPVLHWTETLDSDPGWTTEGLWAYGVPTGGGGQYGNNDPTSGYTGDNVLGYNLEGDYENDLAETHLVSGPIDCSTIEGTTLKFWRWLNVETSEYDHASISVSSDGTNWTQVWTNPSGVEDAAWTRVEYDLSAVADGQSTVYLRWTMGTTDGSWQYSGWNLDDIEIWGLSAYAAAVGDTPRAGVRVGNHPNPFNPSTRIEVELQRAGRVQLDVYDVQGRRVRSLYDGRLDAGVKSFTWDGCDDGGSRLGSGVYFGRVSGDAGQAQVKMVLVK